MITQIDHVALGVADLDERIAFFTETMGMVLKRTGTHVGTGGRIAMVADPASGFKLELIETLDGTIWPTHVAFRVDDVPAEHERLQAAGLSSRRAPMQLAAAKAETALLQDCSGLEIQVISYAPDSPDL